MRHWIALFIKSHVVEITDVKKHEIISVKSCFFDEVKVKVFFCIDFLSRAGSSS